MINLVGNIAKQRHQQKIVRQMTRLELFFAKRLKPILNRQFLDAAKFMRQNLSDIDQVVGMQRLRLKEVYAINYRRIARTFSKEAFKDLRDLKSFIKNFFNLERKGEEEEFWEEMNIWIIAEAARRVLKVQETTKNIIRNIIKKGIEEGLSNREIAKKLVKIGKISTIVRARRIARTETHTATVKTIDTSVRSSRRAFEREWITAQDERVRSDGFSHVAANGERVGMDEPFKRTGEHLRFPGDPLGSAGNIINCRCVIAYHEV